MSDKGGRELFEANKEIYDPSYKIVETQVEVSYNGNCISFHHRKLVHLLKSML